MSIVTTPTKERCENLPTINNNSMKRSDLIIDESQKQKNLIVNKSISTIQDKLQIVDENLYRLSPNLCIKDDDRSMNDTDSIISLDSVKSSTDIRKLISITITIQCLY